MKNCSFENLLVPFLHDELDENDRSIVKTHLDTCDSCQKFLAELKSVDASLATYTRKAAPSDIYSAYEKQLAQLFQPESVWRLLSHRFSAFVSSLFVSNAPAFRTARALAILLVGVFVGRLFFVPVPQPTTQNSPAESHSMLSREDIQYIADYMVKSELLLLTIANTASQEPTDDDIYFNKDIAQTLLYKTAQVQRKAEALEDDVILTYLNHLELVLLEISNRDDDEIRDAFQNIRDMVNEADMVQKSRRLQRRLEQTLQDA